MFYKKGMRVEFFHGTDGPLWWLLLGNFWGMFFAVLVYVLETSEAGGANFVVADRDLRAVPCPRTS